MKSKKFLIFTQILLLVFVVFSFLDINLFAASSVGLGDVDYTEKRDIYNGVSVEYAVGYNNNEEQKAYTVELAKGSLIPYSTYGEYVYGGEILTKMIKAGEAKFNKKVVVAINGDFYDTSNGVPRGIMIVDGKLIALGYQLNSEEALGFLADGTVMFDKPNFAITLNDGTADSKIAYLNNDRKYNTSDLFLYTSDFGTSTKSYADGKEVVLQTSDETFKIGATVKAKVVSIGGKDTKIEPGQIVIGSGNLTDSRLANLTVGKEVSITVTDNSASKKWKDVVQSIGYPHLLAKNGKATSAIEDPAVHPRTALGVKKDGTVVLFQVDGRQPGWSNGLSFKQMVDWMVGVKGCDTVVNLDGGGSSTIAARLPGDENATVLNSPSDGGERSNCNALLFFAPEDADPNKTVAHLHAFPKNLAILGGAETLIKVTATDKNYFPVATPTNVTYSVNNDLVKVENNKVICGKTSGKSVVTISSNGITETMDVQIVDKVTKIATDKTIISVAPNASTPLEVTAYNGSMPLVASDSSFNWTITPSTIGSIKNGVFTGSSAGGTGTLKIEYNGFSTVIPVEVGKLPEMIQTFENITIGREWISTIENPNNGGKGTVSINEDERFVKFGKKSLRIDYDFRQATATTSVTAYQSGGYYKIPGYPTHIGMWVYGDGGGANVRIQIRDGNNGVQYISFDPNVADWTGWKYIEAVVPTGLPAPLSIQYPIRVMSVGGKVKTNGTLYFDNLRAVYGFKNDDLKELTFSDFTPADGAVVTDNQQRVSLKIVDEPDVNNNFTGIKKETIQMWINDVEMTNLVLVDNTDGSITCNYTPSALSLLKPGPQNVKVRAEDNYGNITIKYWSFLLDGEYAGVTGVTPSQDIIYAGDTVNYYVKTKSFKNFEKLTGTLTYNSKALDLVKSPTVAKGTVLETTNGTSVSNSQSTGIYSFSLTGMDKNATFEDENLMCFQFKAKSNLVGGADANIVFEDVLVYETGYKNPTKFMLPSYEVKVDYHYFLTYVTSTVGSDITFKVTDEKLNPVSGAFFDVQGGNIIQTKTDEDGYVTLSNFKNLSVGSTFTLRAMKGKYYSTYVTVKIVDSLCQATPSSIFVTTGANATNSVSITWKTNITTTGTVINYRAKGESEWTVKTIENGTERVYVKAGSGHQEYLAHMALIEGLTPDTTYEYMVGDGTNNSKIYEFKTLPEKNTEIIFLGDPQNSSESGYQITKNTLDQAFKVAPNAQTIMYAGDIVDDVTVNSQWDAFHKTLESYNQKYINVAASGNHDVITGYARPFITSVAPLQNGLDTIGASFSYEIGDACVVVLDTESASMFKEQAAWMASVFNSTLKPFKIVLLHRSPYAANYNEPHIRDFWPAEFEKAGADLVLSGHDHVYSSTTMAAGKKTTTDKGVTYVVGGSCGQKYYNANSLETRYWLDKVYDEDVPVFTTIKIADKVLTLTSYAVTGSGSTEINKIVINAKESNVGSIEVVEKQQVSSLYPLSVKAIIKDKDGAIIDGTVSIALKEEVKGVKVVNNQLVVTNELEAKQTVTLLVSYKGVVTTASVEVFLLLPSDVNTLISDKLNDIYKGYFK